MTTYDLGVSRHDFITASFVVVVVVVVVVLTLIVLQTDNFVWSQWSLISGGFVVIFLLPLSCHLKTLLSVDGAQELGLQQLC